MPPTSSASAAQALQSFSGTMLKPQDAITQGNNQYGVAGIQSQLDALRSLTGNLQTSINGVDPSVTGRTSNSLVTEAQRQAIINKEKQPLLQSFQDTSSKLSDVGHQYDEANGLATHWADALLNTQENRYKDLFGQYTTALDAEQKAAAAAEARRQFDAQMSETKAARAAASGGGLGGLGSLLGGGNAAGGSAAAAGRAPADVAFDLIKQFRSTGMANKTWSGAASWLKTQGVDVSRGSPGDVALNRSFNAGGFQDYMNALKREGKA